MFLQIRNICVLLLIATVLLVKGTTAANCANSNGLVDTKSLLEVFRSLRDVIPKPTLKTILTKQVDVHSKVAEALRYIKSDDFDTVSNKISETTQYQALLQELENSAVNTEGLETVASIIRGILYPFLESLDVNTRISRHRHSRCAIRSLAADIMNVMSKASFKLQLSKYLKTNKNFSKFYKILAQPQFQRKILTSLAAVPIKNQVRILKQHFIDLKAWLNSIFKMISW